MRIDAKNLIQILDGTYYGDMDGIYACYRYLTGGPVFTHSLPSCFKIFQPHLRNAFPSEAEYLEENPSTPENYKSNLDAFISRFGDSFELPKVGMYA